MVGWRLLHLTAPHLIAPAKIKGLKASLRRDGLTHYRVGSKYLHSLRNVRVIGSFRKVFPQRCFRILEPGDIKFHQSISCTAAGPSSINRLILFKHITRTKVRLESCGRPNRRGPNDKTFCNLSAHHHREIIRFFISLKAYGDLFYLKAGGRRF